MQSALLRSGEKNRRGGMCRKPFYPGKNRRKTRDVAGVFQGRERVDEEERPREAREGKPETAYERDVGGDEERVKEQLVRVRNISN